MLRPLARIGVRAKALVAGIGGLQMRHLLHEVGQ